MRLNISLKLARQFEKEMWEKMDKEWTYGRWKDGEVTHYDEWWIARINLERIENTEST